MKYTSVLMHVYLYFYHIKKNKILRKYIILQE